MFFLGEIASNIPPSYELKHWVQPYSLINYLFWLLCASVKTFSISPMCVASLDGSFVSTVACNLEVPDQVRIPVGPDICHRGCAYTVLQTVQRHGVYIAVYGTVYYKEQFKFI